jgi:hypothetical protein
VGELVLTAADAAALRALFDTQLSKRRAFVVGAGGVEAPSSCALVVRCGGRSNSVQAEIVYVRAEEPGRGVGVELPIDAVATLRAFVEECEERIDEGAEPHGLHDRIRGLSSIEQQKLAAAGTLPERIALERMYGPSVWDTLLRNPRITIPEVARIARKGTVPRPLLELVATNASWIGVGEVQRALLGNPRSTQATIVKVLGAMPRAELARTAQQTAYPLAVRNTAKKLLGG